MRKLTRPPAGSPRSRALVFGLRSTTSERAIHRWPTSRSSPFDALKIDRSFITGLTDNREGETLIRTLVQELSLLREEDCDSGQGFLLATLVSTAALL
jgi:hypothetical protein